MTHFEKTRRKRFDEVLDNYCKTVEHLFDCIGFSEGQACCLEKPHIRDLLYRLVEGDLSTTSTSTPLDDAMAYVESLESFDEWGKKVKASRVGKPIDPIKRTFRERADVDVRRREAGR